MTDIVEELREYAVGSSLPVEQKLIEKAVDEIEKLRRAMHEIYEVYAGSEGDLKQAEGYYLLCLITEMSGIAAEHKK